MKKLLIVLLLTVSSPLWGVRRKTVHHHYPLSGSSLILPNEEVERLQLPRIIDDRQLHDLEKTGELVRLQNCSFAPHLTEDRRYGRPWMVAFVDDLSGYFQVYFAAPLQVNSAVRTQEQQRKLMRVNRYAASPSLSTHTTGTTVDLEKRRLSPRELKWLRKYLTNLRDRGLIVVSEEPQCFHVAVLEIYLEGRNESIL